MPQHPDGRRARIVLYDVAREQIEALSPGDLIRVDAVLEVIARDPKVGALTKNGPVREYRDGGVRIVYVPTALGTLVLVAYVEA